jgi:hypothetical protein
LFFEKKHINLMTPKLISNGCWDQNESMKMKTIWEPYAPVNVRYVHPVDLICHLSSEIDKEARRSTAKFFLSYVRVGSGLGLQRFLQEQNLTSSASMRNTWHFDPKNAASIKGFTP